MFQQHLLQLALTEWFGEVVVEALVKESLLIAFQRIGRHGDHRGCGG